MTTAYFLLGLLAVAASPWLSDYLKAFLSVPYGFLILILLASLSFAVALHPDFLEMSADLWAFDWGISVGNELPPAVPATRSMLLCCRH